MESDQMEFGFILFVQIGTSSASTSEWPVAVSLKNGSKKIRQASLSTVF